MTRRFRSFLPQLSLLTVCATLAPGVLAAQGADAGSRIKIGATSLVGIVHVGVERPLRRDGRTFQWDVMVSPWRSVEDYPFTFAVGAAEWRFYREARAEGWYAALNAGAAVFRIQRPDYRDTTLYQEGASLLVGGSVGRVWQLRGGWTLDAFVGGGSVQSLYKGYDRATGRRYDGAKLWNVSGELFPYRSGILVGLPWRRTR
ncbi:MAG: DUF3575 domain-containing protein [Gemmatimonadaceae bacterium]|nr:DUF3575 domain-containing protein [Gemmatimonadaceae bacterium]